VPVVRRLLPTVLVVALLGATAGAFAVTERLKLEPAPIVDPRFDNLFAPTCDCPTRAAGISFGLREPDRVTVEVLDEDGRVVRTLVDGERLGTEGVSERWDGRTESGALAPDGTYRVRIDLENQRRTIVPRERIRLDSAAPQLTLVGYGPEVFSPDGDGRSEKVRLRFRVSEPANVELRVRDRTEVKAGRLVDGDGKLEWYARAGGKGLPSGSYRVVLTAQDRAGNRAKPTQPVPVRVRYIELGRRLVTVRTRTRFGIGVRTDARSYRWRLGRRSGRRSVRVLVLRAPASAGRYRLTVSANGRRDVAIVRVRARS
jgi:hypothetical protein